MLIMNCAVLINIERNGMKAYIRFLAGVAGFTALSVSACRIELVNDTSIKMMVKDQDMGAFYLLDINGSQIVGDVERRPSMGIYMQVSPHETGGYTKQFTVKQIGCSPDKSKPLTLNVSDIIANTLDKAVFERSDSANGHKKIVPMQGHHH
jgi:hypothetical protein